MAAEPMDESGAGGAEAEAASAGQGGFPRHVVCKLCQKPGDAGEGGRMLFVEPGCWAHVNCLAWSSEVVETVAGDLTKVHSMLQRTRKIGCAHCGQPGASIGCNVHRCKRSFHLPCLGPAGALVLADRRVYCEDHRSVKAAARGSALHELPLADRRMRVQPSKRSSPEDWPHGHWLRVGALTVLHRGERPQKPGDPPAGSVARRRHWSTLREEESCWYELRISGAEDGALALSVLSEHEPERPIECTSALEVAAASPFARASLSRANAGYDPRL